MLADWGRCCDVFGCNDAEHLCCACLVFFSNIDLTPAWSSAKDMTPTYTVSHRHCCTIHILNELKRRQSTRQMRVRPKSQSYPDTRPIYDSKRPKRCMRIGRRGVTCRSCCALSSRAWRTSGDACRAVHRLALCPDSRQLAIHLGLWQICRRRGLT